MVGLVGLVGHFQPLSHACHFLWIARVYGWNCPTNPTSPTTYPPGSGGASSLTAKHPGAYSEAFAKPPALDVFGLRRERRRAAVPGRAGVR
jgi:hypothetical protein